LINTPCLPSLGDYAKLDPRKNYSLEYLVRITAQDDVSLLGQKEEASGCRELRLRLNYFVTTYAILDLTHD